jgi:hypothetical protein
VYVFGIEFLFHSFFFFLFDKKHVTSLVSSLVSFFTTTQKIVTKKNEMEMKWREHLSLISNLGFLAKEVGRERERERERER